MKNNGNQRYLLEIRDIFIYNFEYARIASNGRCYNEEIIFL